MAGENSSGGSRRRALRLELLLVLMVVLCGLFFPDWRSKPRQPHVSDRPFFVANENGGVPDYFGNALDALEEPSLWKRSQSDQTAAAFRVLCVPSFSRPFAVRVERNSTGAELRLVQLEGSSDDAPARIARASVLQLTPAQWADLDALAEKSGFWSMAPGDESVISDGTALVMEGLRHGAYHAVHRQSPRIGPYQRLCVYLLALSGPGQLHFFGNREPLSLQLGRFALVKAGRLALAIRFLNHTRIGRGGSDYGGATYEWFLQTDGTGDFQRNNVVVGRGEVLGAPHYRPKDMEIVCGPLTLEWAPCYSDSDHIRALRGKCRLGLFDVVSVAVSDWSTLEDIDWKDRYLVWSQGE